MAPACGFAWSGRDLIDIPVRVQTNDFVLKLAEGVSDEAAAATLARHAARVREDARRARMLLSRSQEIATMQVTIPEASRRLAQLIRSVQAGDEVLIAEGETPVARLLPVVPATEPNEEPGRARTILDWLACSPVPLESRRTAEEMDAAIAAERGAWD